MDNIIKEWYSQVFNAEYYELNSYIDYRIYNVDIEDWENLINNIRKKFKIVIMDFNRRPLENNFQIKKLLESDNYNNFF